MTEVRLSASASPIAREVYRRMRERKLGQKALATAAGLNETYVRDLYKGKSLNPKQEQLQKLANALECSVEALLHPGSPEEIEQDKYTAKTPEERALIDVWRRASPIARDEILRAIERVMIGALSALSQTKNV